MYILQTPIDYLKGVGPARADLLKKELKIFTYGDLLQHYPFRYLDRSVIYKISDLIVDMPFIQIKGKIINQGLIATASICPNGWLPSSIREPVRSKRFWHEHNDPLPWGGGPCLPRAGCPSLRKLCYWRKAKGRL